jgi:hypothetical protein
LKVVRQTKAQREFEEFVFVWVLGLGLFLGAYPPAGLAVAALFGFLCGIIWNQRKRIKRIVFSKNPEVEFQ